ncbi:MAG: nicotinate phosphoribosyltransferase [Pseudomonadota bacterium]
MDQIASSESGFDAAIDRLIDLTLSAASHEALTDKYFSHSRRIAEANGDSEVTYAVFMRRRVIAALEPACRLIKRLAPDARIVRFFEDGDLVLTEQKLMEITGPFSQLAEVETLLLQKIGLPCVAANNAYEMCRAMPRSAFMDMHARHGAGPEMNLLAAYGAAVGSQAARKLDSEIVGFTGSSQDLTAPLFGADRGMGTMPHALVGFSRGDVLEATKLFVDAVPDNPVCIALVDYSGREIGDSLACADWFFNRAKLDRQGKTFGVRLDTHGGRFAEGLDYERSVKTVGDWLGVAGEYTIAEQVLGLRAFQLDTSNILVDRVRRILFGAGVSVAAIIHTRRALDNAGFTQAQIVASSGFGVQKCQVMGAANAPVDMVGTGSFLPATMSETYATADIIAYDGEQRVKVGREFLFS